MNNYNYFFQLGSSTLISYVHTNAFTVQLLTRLTLQSMRFHNWWEFFHFGPRFSNRDCNCMMNWCLHLCKFTAMQPCRNMFGLSKERPILGDNRKAHSEKRCAFHEKQHWKPDPKGRCVLNQLFLMISGAFHMKSAAFRKTTCKEL